jgi:hypothetical protein
MVATKDRTVAVFGGSVFLGDRVVRHLRASKISCSGRVKLEPDGSLFPYLQPTSPGADKQSTWLPAPKQGRFIIPLRTYGPSKTTIDGNWRPPSVIMVNSTEVAWGDSSYEAETPRCWRQRCGWPTENGLRRIVATAPGGTSSRSRSPRTVVRDAAFSKDLLNNEMSMGVHDAF